MHIPWSYYATPLELGFKPWALDFAPNNYGDDPFPKAIFDPVSNNLQWQNADWDPALRLWTLPWDPNLTEWLRDEDTSLPSITTAREFAKEHAKWRFEDPTELVNRGWLKSPAHLAWQTSFAAIQGEIEQLFQLMEDDRDRYLGEINAQADGLAAYIISFLWADGERRPWTIELIRCGLAIGNLFYMHYKALFRRVRASTICPGLVPPFGPPRHPSFPSGHSFLGHFIGLLLLDIPEVAKVFGEKLSSGQLGKPPLTDVMSASVFKGPLLWLAERLGKNRERAGLHYPSDSAASRFLAGAVWALLTMSPGAAATPPGATTHNPVTASDMIDCPSLQHVLRMAKAEWAR